MAARTTSVVSTGSAGDGSLLTSRSDASSRSGGGHERQRSARRCCGTCVRMLLRVFLSVSFLVLVLSTVASLLPSLLIWAEAVKGGMHTLQEQYLDESIARRTIATTTSMLDKLQSCESVLLGFSAFLNTLSAINGSDLSLLQTKAGLSAYGLTKTCGESVVTYGRDGLTMLVKNVVMIQNGYPTSSVPRVPIMLYPLNVKTYTIMYQRGIFAGYGVGYLSELSATDLATVTNTSNVVWGDPVARSDSVRNLAYTTEEVTAGWIDPDTQTLRGVIQLSLSSRSFDDYVGSDEDGVFCTYIQDVNGCLMTSSCENSTFFGADGHPYQRCAYDSVVPEVRTAYSIWNETGDYKFGQLVTVKRDGLVFSFQYIDSAHGFEAVVVLISDEGYFDKEYNNASRVTTALVIVGVVIAFALSLIVTCIFCLVQLSVIRRIQSIMDAHIGKERKKHRSLVTNKVSPGNTADAELGETDSDTDETVELEVGHTRPSVWEKLNVFSYFSEAAFILSKLAWLDGKVRIVSAFLPVVAKIVCARSHADASDDVVLQSSLARRHGSYFFVDIQGFTPLCEGVTPDTAGKVLELFYTAVERCAHASEENLLIKRLGDGVFITWGFKLAMEKSRHEKQFPVLSYAAALRVAESVVQVNAQIQELIELECDKPWQLTLRVGITSGPALHGLLKTGSLLSPDTIGHLINLAARCQACGKLPEVQALSAHDPTADRIVCVIVTDQATSSAVTHIAEGTSELAALAARCVTRYPRSEAPSVHVVGVGEVDLTVTFVTEAMCKRGAMHVEDL
eukprot:TRINITY_DN17621_c0_g1_i1.p1 TRINITY_DN17621_c0_g1~~TRINITY_DN17621_c0_g1_i1.p1  ORF type:complete len:800 (-),score=173.85 TRINITY_DN17621_c0_g1_i1:41-2416(-)